MFVFTQVNQSVRRVPMRLIYSVNTYGLKVYTLPTFPPRFLPRIYLLVSTYIYLYIQSTSLDPRSAFPPTQRIAVSPGYKIIYTQYL